MPRKRKLSNVSKSCRICLSAHGCMTNLFEGPLQSKIKDLAKCTSIDIKHESDLPSVICHICLYKLDMWSEFKEQFIQSNQMLLDQLGASEVSDNVAINSKRKHEDSHQTGEDSLSDTVDKKKAKTDVPPLIPLEFASVDCVMDQVTLKEMYISEDEPASSKDSFQKIRDTSDDKQGKVKEGEVNESGEQDQVKPSLVPMKVKTLCGKRGRTTERRKASTKRWVARKKALLAATGENASDTDSMASDDELSPVQKARAKSNADKEAERQKRLSKALKHLDCNVSGIKNDSDEAAANSDTDSKKTKSKTLNTDGSQNESGNSVSKENNIEEECTTNKELTQEDSVEEENSPVPIANINDSADAAKSQNSKAVEDNFTPQSVKSELEVGDATYIVTSTLILAEPQYIDKANLNNLPKDYKSFSIDESSQEKNTDIIDAVQLRRIHPVSNDSNEKKSIERCLNIEVEGTELEALKRVQVELAGFVEKEMKYRLFGTSVTRKENVENIQKTSYQTLDQQLKHIVEKAIKKNFESSMARADFGVSKDIVESRTLSPTFVKSALTSKKYQPKVVVKRLDITKESKNYKINNVHALRPPPPKSRLSGPFSMVARKRQSVQPRKFNDYNTFGLDSDSNLSDDVAHIVTTGPSKQTNRQMNTVKQEDTKTRTVERIGRILVPAAKNTMVVSEPKREESEKHICGVCGQSFETRKEVEVHVRTHKVEASTPRHNKHKMMRCKRCHEIVEARFVKAHVCRSTRQIHKCYVCDSTFRTEKLLVRHLESHDQSEFSIENITKVEFKKLTDVQGTKQMVTIKTEKDQAERMDRIENIQADLNEIVQVEKLIGVKGSKSEGVKALEKPKETYTCFVCDKTFTDEEILKDHLQKHCDDMSEDEQSTGKEQYQCAICGDSLDSEDALEAHVEKHLFDDEDDNPNLISIGNENEKAREEPYQCLQCAEVFNSEMMLEMHMQAHEEEAAIAEWEKQGIKAYEYQCMICDELFETEEELSEHLDVHNGNAHVCQLCEKPFSTLEDLQKHVATH